MSNRLFDDDDIRDLFLAVPSYRDAEAFEARVTRGLRLKLWLRQGFVALAGLVGGLYALVQFMRLPNWTLGDRTAMGGVVASSSLQKAATETGQTFHAGVEFMDVIGKNVMNFMESSGHYLDFMQKPIFFWLSFSLCLACLALYYAYSQEETI